MGRMIDADALLNRTILNPMHVPYITKRDIEDAPTMGGWISVKDRLPEVGKVVLAFGTRSATTGMFQGTVANRPDIWMWKNHTPKKVSHWMPLPEPPEE